LIFALKLLEPFHPMDKGPLKNNVFDEGRCQENVLDCKMIKNRMARNNRKYRVMKKVFDVALSFFLIVILLIPFLCWQF